jgi:hypothetical protein
MDTQQSAQGLASLGRYGDTMLVHMSPKEVEGLQGLAMAQGGSLTINPDTGLPEAFILPMLGGAALSKFMSPMAAGLLIGGATAVTSGDIGKGIMAGLGGYGGADLGAIFTKMGASKAAIPGSAPTGEIMKQAIDANKINIMNPTGAPGVNVFSGAGAPGVKLGATQPYSGITGSTGQMGANLGAIKPRAALDVGGLDDVGTDVLSGSNFGNLDYSLGTNAAAPASGTYSQMGEGFGKFIKDPFGEGFEAFKVAGGEGGVPLETGDAAMKLGSPVLGGVLGALEPPMPKPYEDPDKNKYRGPQGQLNLSDNFDTGLRLVAKGGAIKSYALGGSVGNPSVGGGLSSLYNRPEGQAPQNISNDAYGLGRLSDLGSEQARYQAQTLGYAMGGLTALKSGGQPGGYLDGEGDGMSDSIPATIEGKQPARLADGEFVIPADVVSHLGNGSSKAGSKRLYAMLDKVRHARTGNKKQGKEIKADKYLPA